MSHRICCVRNCYQRSTKDVSLFNFPTNRIQRDVWLERLPLKNLSDSSRICSNHFRNSEFKAVKNGKRLLPNAVPSENLDLSEKKKRRTSKKMIQELCYKFNFVEEKPDPDENKENNNDSNTLKHGTIDFINADIDDISEEEAGQPEVHYDSSDECKGSISVPIGEVCEVSKDFVDNVINSIKNLSPVISNNVEENEAIENILNSTKQVIENVMKQYTVMDLIRNFKDLHYLTNLKNYGELNTIAICVKNTKKFEYLKPYLQSNLEIGIVLVLMKLKHNLPYTVLSVLFQLSPNTVSLYFFEMVHIMNTALTPALYFPTKAEILLNLPKYFSQFPDTRLILDCTEISINVPKCLHCKICTYSHYKGLNTVKFLIGVSPGGLVTFISPGYSGRASDKLIFNKSGVLSLVDQNDSVMLDRGFSVRNECFEAGIRLNIPANRSSKNQFSQETAIESQNIASARIHIERSIQRLKLFHILHGPVDSNTFHAIDTIVSLICMLVNLQTPILSEDKF